MSAIDSAAVSPAAAEQRSALDRIGAWAERTSDRVNPLVIKEVRQGLRTRVFWVVFALLLVACFVISMVAYGTVGSTALTERGGQWFFFAYFVPLAFAYFFVLPYNAFRSLLKERDDETWVLLTLTGLGPRRILRGKLGSVAVQAALYGSAVLPFLVLSYDLNGIDLLAILAVIALAWAFHVFLTAASVSLGTFGEAKLVRGLISFAVLGLLVAALAGGLQAAYAVVDGGLSLLAGKDFWIATGICTWLMLSTGLLLFEVGAARLSLPTENYSVGPRLALVFQVAGTAAMIAVGWALNKRDAEGAAILSGLLGLYVTFAGLFLSTDLDGQAPRLRRQKGTGRIFTPGALRGYRFYVGLMFGLFFATVALIHFSSASSHKQVSIPALWGAPAYALLYVSAPVLVANVIPRVNPVVGARVLAVLFLLAGVGLPPLLGQMLLWGTESRWLNTFNPLVGMNNLMKHTVDASDGVRLAALWATALLVWFFADAVLAKRDAEAKLRGR